MRGSDSAAATATAATATEVVVDEAMAGRKNGHRWTMAVMTADPNPAGIAEMVEEATAGGKNGLKQTMVVATADANPARIPGIDSRFYWHVPEFFQSF
mmetsp:Transcript_78149/g.154914  ORF Transcript_78149/g.154914 Transcript_78149/m.154914 type:complete len:98 (-) Transcript_78149:21-314(-)